MGFGLYDVKNPAEYAGNILSGASNTLSRMDKKMGQSSVTETTGPGKTAGGAMMSTMAGGLSGLMIGAEIGAIGGPWGAAIGAGIGLLSYLL